MKWEKIIAQPAKVQGKQSVVVVVDLVSTQIQIPRIVHNVRARGLLFVQHVTVQVTSQSNKSRLSKLKESRGSANKIILYTNTPQISQNNIYSHHAKNQQNRHQPPKNRRNSQ